MFTEDAPKMSPSPTVLDVRDAATYTNLSRTTLYRMMALGEFAPRIRLSARRFGFRRVDIDSWLEGRREKLGQGER